MNTTPQGERVHIAVFGRRNAGKSSLVNALTGQAVSIVSEIKGTTTDPVRKAMELPPLGPVLFIDTPGLDDEGSLGEQRVRRAYDVLAQTDLALLVVDATVGFGACEADLLAALDEREIPTVVVANKMDARAARGACRVPRRAVWVSCATGEGVEPLLRSLADATPGAQSPAARPLVRDRLAAGDVVVLVTPIDGAAPKGRLILPQQQVIRDILDAHATALVTQPSELALTLARLTAPPRMVITDSQAFAAAAAATPPGVELTSFSILFARYKGDLAVLEAGADALAGLQDGDRVLVAEGCTHHRQADDIGTVKIPGALRRATGKALAFEHVRGGDYPADVSGYALIVHCGACMMNRRGMLHRIRLAQAAGVPITNYGVLLERMRESQSRS